MSRPLSTKLLSFSHLFCHRPFLKSPPPFPPPLHFSSSTTTTTTLPLTDSGHQTERQFIVSLLKSHGFNDSQIADAFSKFPKLCRSRSSTVKPKFEFLTNFGFTESQIHQLVLLSPRFLLRSLDNHLKPCFDFLRSFVFTEDIVKPVRRHTWLLNLDLTTTMVRCPTQLISSNEEFQRLMSRCYCLPS